MPDNIRNDDQLMQYFKDWRPTYAPGTYRTYANPGIGTLGLITAKSMGQDFAALMERAPVSRARHEEQLHQRSRSQNG